MRIALIAHKSENMGAFALDPSTIISAGIGLAGNLMSGSAAGDAASAQQASDAAAIAEQQREFNLVQKNEAPFLTAGQGGVNALSWLLGLGSPTGNQPVAATSSASSSSSPSGQYFLTGKRGTGTPGTNFHLSSDGTKVMASNGVVLSPQGIKNAIAQGYIGSSGTNAGGTTAPSSAPATSGGYGGSGSFGSLTHPFSQSDFQVDPGYQFALQQGQAALQRTQAANGQLQSGAAAKAMDDYTQGVANQQYGAAYDRYNTNQNNLYNRLMGVTQIGQTAASNQAAAGTNMANQVSNLTQDSGNSASAGILGQGQAWQTGLSGLGSALSPHNYVGTQSGQNYGTINWNSN